VSSENIEAVKFFLDKGCDIDSKDQFGYTPLNWILNVGGRKPELIKLLIDREQMSTRRPTMARLRLYMLLKRKRRK
jgi:hypothetical protein